MNSSVTVTLRNRITELIQKVRLQRLSYCDDMLKEDGTTEAPTSVLGEMIEVGFQDGHSSVTIDFQVSQYSFVFLISYPGLVNPDALVDELLKGYKIPELPFIVKPEKLYVGHPSKNELHAGTQLRFEVTASPIGM